MSKDDELERRAIEELLKETNRARVRAETMGPTGWLKCPLRSTNKRFLLNTLRSTDLQRRGGESSERHSPARGRQRDDSPVRHRDRSRSPVAKEHSSKGDRRNRRGSSGRNNRDKSRSGDGHTGYRHRDKRDERHSGDSHNRNKRSTL